MRSFSLIIFDFERNDCGVDQHLAGMLEIDGDAIADDGLDLPDSPIGLRGMTDPHAWFDDGGHGSRANVVSTPQRIPSGAMTQGMPRAMPSETMPADLRLTRLVGLRLCHDLGGVVGTIGNALDMMDGPGSEAATLAQDAAEVLRRRLVLWRALLGGQGETTLGAALALLEGQLSGGRARADAAALDPALPVAEAVVPVVLAAMLLGGESLPRGGQVRLGGDGRREFAIWPDGQRAAWPPTLLRALAGGPLPEDPIGRDVLVVWLCAVAAAAGVRLTLALPPGESAGPLLLALPR
jgi:histidine phosphotransferase ChpT